MSAAKQRLMAHVAEHHGRRRLPPRLSMEGLARWHANEHHRLAFLDHYHAGPNLGPDQRPSGWRTGADAVVNR